jgi:hypothetical protein
MCGETRQNCPKFKMKEYFLGLSGRTDRMKLWRLSLSSLIVALGVLAFSNRFAIGRSTSSGSSPNTSTPDLSGFWQLKFDSENVPRASLAPVAAGVDQDSQARRDMYAIRWCNHLGMPLIMGVPSPLDIRQGRTEVAIASEAVSAARHIYIDGRGHPDMNTYDPQSNGHSRSDFRIGAQRAYRAVDSGRRTRSSPSAFGCWREASVYRWFSRGKTRKYFQNPIPTSSDITRHRRGPMRANISVMRATRIERNF